MNNVPYDKIAPDLKEYYTPDRWGNARGAIETWAAAPDEIFHKLKPNQRFRLREWVQGDPLPVRPEPPTGAVFATLVDLDGGARWLYAIDRRIRPALLGDADIFVVLDEPWKNWPESTRLASAMATAPNVSLSNLYESRPMLTAKGAPDE